MHNFSNESYAKNTNSIQIILNGKYWLGLITENIPNGVVFSFTVFDFVAYLFDKEFNGSF